MGGAVEQWLHLQALIVGPWLSKHDRLQNVDISREAAEHGTMMMMMMMMHKADTFHDEDARPSCSCCRVSTFP